MPIHENNPPFIYLLSVSLRKIWNNAPPYANRQAYFNIFHTILFMYIFLIILCIYSWLFIIQMQQHQPQNWCQVTQSYTNPFIVSRPRLCKWPTDWMGKRDFTISFCAGEWPVQQTADAGVGRQLWGHPISSRGHSQCPIKSWVHFVTPAEFDQLLGRYSFFRSIWHKLKSKLRMFNLV